jgi:hypothetical protein
MKIDRMLDRFIERWLRWEQQRNARPMGAVEAPRAPRPTARHLVITKVLFSAVVALSVAIGLAIPVSADPSAFGVLSCSCGGGLPEAVGGPTVPDQMNDGIQDGLADLQGVSG